MAALELLLAGVMARWHIPPQGVIAHSDMAPSRKGDPGWRFDWRRLALQGLAVWPEAGDADVAGFWANLAEFGYPVVPEAEGLTAFRLRFRPWAAGALSADDARIAAGLVKIG